MCRHPSDPSGSFHLMYYSDWLKAEPELFEQVIPKANLGVPLFGHCIDFGAFHLQLCSWF